MSSEIIPLKLRVLGICSRRKKNESPNSIGSNYLLTVLASFAMKSAAYKRKQQPQVLL
jgi:hypothetical protein